MSNNKNALLRYQILDKCFSDFTKKYTIDELLEKVNLSLLDLSGTEVGMRQIRDDIKYMRDRTTYDAPIVAYALCGKKCYYRYADPDFSIFNNVLDAEDIQVLGNTIDMLSKYRGLPANRWLEEIISSLEIRFGIKRHAENLISFDYNDRLKGLEYLSFIIDATINHQTLNIDYVSADGLFSTHVLHPYYVKQYNNRWFLFGMDNAEEIIKNLALDRIKKIEKSGCLFRKNEIVDFNSYFENVIGVSVPYAPYPELMEIQLKFSSRRFKYVTSKPLHKSQKVINDADCVVSIKVFYTQELEQQIFSFGPDVEVISPLWLREQFIQRIKDCLKIYSLNDDMEG